MKKNSVLLVIASLAICLGTGALGGVLTATAITEWYNFLIKPSFSPPNWIFGPVWTLLYTLMAISVSIVWRKGLSNKENRAAFIYFMVQLFLNGIWSILFFGLKNPLLALIDIIILLLMIVVVIYKFHRINKIAAYLLIPYLLWVSFASVLNYSIWQLN